MPRELLWRLIIGVAWRLLLVASLLGWLWANAASSAEPTPQIVVPCEIVEVYDGDTVTVRVTLTARVRLKDCWTAEVQTRDPAEKALGLEQRDALRDLVGPLPGPAWLSIPLAGADRFDDVVSFGRLLGAVTLQGDSQSLSEHMRRRGQAFATKRELLDVMSRLE